ncbi:MAG: lysophospholipid acyltransferase family protein [Saccharofermentanales bacterium]
MAEPMNKENADGSVKEPVTPAIFERYPVKRGIQGEIGYALGMLATHIFLRLRGHDTENIPKNAPFVISPNHVTYVDGMWVASFLTRKQFNVMCCMAAKELEDSHGWLGRLIMKVGRGIAADRFGNPVRALILAKKQLDKGQILLLHPEGTRSPDGKLGELKDGASYLATKSECPLLPVYIYGGYDVFNRHMKFPKPLGFKPFRRKKVDLYFGKPLLPCDYKKATDMTAALTDWMMVMQDKAEKGLLK